MSDIKNIILVTVLVLCATLAAGAQATTVTAGSGSIPVPGQTANFPITVDSLPDGLSGFNITASLGDPTKAEIVGIIFPSWSPVIPGFSQIGPLPADSVWFVGVDFGNQITPGATNVNVGTIQVRGDAPGTTSLQVTLNKFQAEGGSSISATVVPGTITIGTPTTTPTTTATTTIPTTTPTTTATTTIPTTTPTTPPTTTITTVTSIPTTAPTTAPAGFGTVFVTSYPTGATVLVDGIDKGKTNIIIPGITAGVRTFTVMKAGYLTETFTVNVPVGGLATPPKVNLVKGTSPTTTVTTIPTTTPTTTATTTVPTTTPTTFVPTTTPAPPGSTGSLYVYSIPVGATVHVDGVFMGYGPDIFTGVAPGSHVLMVSKEGYRTDVRTFTINAGRTTFVPVFLVPDVGIGLLF